jgi:hypothetical protein
MRFTTLISWLLTASLGAFMLRTCAGSSPRPAGCRHGCLPAVAAYPVAGAVIRLRSAASWAEVTIPTECATI